MTPEKLDFIFPFFVCGYGAVMTFVLNTSALLTLAEKSFPDTLNAQLRAHRGLALICLVLGGLWSMQNLWLN